MRMKRVVVTACLAVLTLVGQADAAVIWDAGHHVWGPGDYDDEIFMYNDTTADLTGGTVNGILWLYNTSVASIFSPSQINMVHANDFSTAHIYGGQIDFIRAFETTHIYLYGGAIGEIDVLEQSVFDFYVSDYSWDPDGGVWSAGLITGHWYSTNQYFSISTTQADAINHIHFVPEPLSLTLLLAAGLFTVRRRFHSQPYVRG